MPRRSRAATPAQALLGLLLGALVGVVGTVAHLLVLVAGGVRWPVGIVLALLLVGLAARLLTALAVRWPVTVGSVVGWLVVVALASFRRREGDLLVVAGWRGSVWLLGGLVLQVAVLTLTGPTAPTAPGRPTVER